MKLRIYRGIPGSGKSTLARKENNCLILENDMFHMKNGKYEFDRTKQQRAVDWCYSACETALAAGMDVAVANTFTQRRFVESYRQLAEAYGAEFEVIRCTGRFKDVHSVPEGVLKSMAEHFDDWPSERFARPE